MKTTIYITRHGLSEHNLSTEIYMGRSPESRLVEQGREQASLLGARMAKEFQIDQIISSSLMRTMETSRLIAKELGLGNVTEEPAFWELSKGSWEGSMPRDLPDEWRNPLEADPFGFRYPEGESYADVVARIAPAFDRWSRKLAGKNLLFVLHGDVVRALLHHLLQFPPEKIGDFIITPCSLTEFYVEAGRWTLVRYNDTGHLKADLGVWPPPDRIH